MMPNGVLKQNPHTCKALLLCTFKCMYAFLDTAARCSTCSAPLAVQALNFPHHWAKHHHTTSLYCQIWTNNTIYTQAMYHMTVQAKHHHICTGHLPHQCTGHLPHQCTLHAAWLHHIPHHSKFKLYMDSGGEVASHVA